jgi:hypothetical protein
MNTTKRISTAIATAATALATVVLANQTATAAAPTATGANISATAHSTNWAGALAATGHKGTFQGVAGNWRVPRVTGPGYSCTWVGVDGNGRSHLIQTGTEEEFYNGQAHYFAWFEILPQEQTEMPIHLPSGALAPVRPGDEMFAYVMHSGRGIWTIHLADKTQHWTYNHRFYYDTPELSAEWIQEAPTVNNHHTAPADFGSVTFTNLQIKENGKWYYTRLGDRNRLNQVFNGHLYAEAGRPTNGSPQTITVRYHG